MATITISRQFGCHGDRVARLLCDRLGYRYFDKELMLGLADQMGIKPNELGGYAEERTRARTLIEKLFANFTPPMGDPGIWAAVAEAHAEDQRQRGYVNQLILAAHQQGNVVIIGRGGQYVLKGLENVLSVRLIAPLELRVRCHQQRTGLTAEAAREEVLCRDQASADYVHNLFDVDVANPELYHLILNTGMVDPERAVELIVKALDLLPFQVKLPKDQK